MVSCHAKIDESWHKVQGETFLQDVRSGAFQAYAGLTSLQQAPCGCPSPCNIAVLQTVALKALHHAGEAHPQQSPVPEPVPALTLSFKLYLSLHDLQIWRRSSMSLAAATSTASPLATAA